MDKSNNYLYPIGLLDQPNKEIRIILIIAILMYNLRVHIPHYNNKKGIKAHE